MAKQKNTGTASKESLQNQEKSTSFVERENKLLQQRSSIAQQYDTITKNILKTEEKIQELMVNQNDNLDEIISLMQKKEKLENGAVKLEEKSKKNQEEFKDLRNDEIKATEKLKKYREEQEKKQQKIKALQKDINVDMSKSEALVGKMNENAQQFIKETSASSILNKQQNAILEQSTKLIAQQGSLSISYQQTLQGTRSITSEIGSLERDMAEQINEVAEGKYKAADFTNLENQLLDRKVAIQSKLSGMSKAEQDQALALLKQEENALSLLKEKDAAFQEMSKKAEESKNASDKMVESLSSLATGDLQGGIQSLFSVDKLRDDFKNKLGKSILDVSSAIRGEKGLVGGFKAVGASITGLAGTLAKLSFAGIIGGFVKMVMDADEEVANLGKEMGVSYNEARELHHAAIDISNEMGIVGINAKEVAQAMGSVSEMYGGIDIGAQLASGNTEMKKLVENTAVLTKNFGLSNEEVKNIHDISVMTGKSMDQLVQEANDVGKGTMTAKSAMKALAGIPPQVTVAFKGSTKELIAAAAKAKMLGMELGRVQQIGRGMLEIESSLEAQFEAQVLTGKNLQLDKARQLALEGDIFGLQEEILNQAGSLEEFTKMNTLQQESMAKAMGMSVEEMTKMLTNAQKLKDAKIDSAMATNLEKMSAQELEEASKSAANQEQANYIKQLAAEKRSASMKEAMADILTKIKQRFAPIIDAVLKFVGGTEKGKGAVSGFEAALAKIDFNEIAKQIEAVLPKLVEGFGQLMKHLPDIIKNVMKFVDKLSGGIGPVSSILGFINPSVAGFGLMAAKVVGPKGVVEGLKLAGQGAMGLFGVIKGPLTEGVGKLAGGVTDKLGGAFGKVADKAKSGLGKVMESMGKGKKPEMPDAGSKKKGGIGDSIADFTNKVDGKKLIMVAVAMVIFAGALYVAAKAFQEFGKVNWENAWPGIAVMAGMVVAALALGKAKKEAMIGAAAILVLSAALLVTAIALNMFGTVNFESVLIGVGALGVLALMAYGLGAAGPMALLGAAAILVLGLAMMAFGEGAKKLGEALAIATPAIDAFFGGLSTLVETVGNVIVNAINAIGDQINKILDKLLAIGNLDPMKLAAIALAIGGLGGALAAFGGGSGLGAIADGLGGLFGGDSPFEQIIKIQSQLKPEIMMGIAMGIQALGNSTNVFSKAMSGFPTDKLEDLADGIVSMSEKLAKADFKGLSVLSLVGKFSSMVDPSKISGTGAAMVAFGESMQSEGIKNLAALNLNNLWIIIGFSEKTDPAKITAIGESFKILGQIFGDVANSINTFTESLSKIDLSKLESTVSKLSEAKQKISEGGGASSVSVFDSMASMVSGIFGGESSGGSSNASTQSTVKSEGKSGVEQKLSEAVNILSQILSSMGEPGIIKFGEKTVEEMNGNLKLKKSYNVKVDNTYGRVVG